jgi:Rab-GTPase-TBC domain
MTDRASPSSAAFRHSLHGLPYAETVASKPPKLLTSLTSSKHAGSPLPKSPLSPSIDESKLRNGETNLKAFDASTSALSSTSSIPQIRVDEEKDKAANKVRLPLRPTKSTSNMNEAPTKDHFQGIALDIPTSDFSKDLSPDTLKFSKRGSMLIDTRRAKSTTGRKQAATLEPIVQEKRPKSHVQPRTPSRILSTDEETLSEKVRSYYAFGSETQYDSDAHSSIANRIGLRWQDALGAKTEASSVISLSRATSATDVHSEIASQRNGERSPSIVAREEHELAGGMEDWQDVDNADVDRYGFIVPSSDASGLNRSGTAKLTRVSTSLQLATETPRQKYTVRRSPSSAHGRPTSSIPRDPSEQSLRRPVSSQSLRMSRHSTFRSRDRKVTDSAADMLTLPRSSSALQETGQPASEDPRARRKETEREEKWRRMATPIPSNQHGGGMAFTFNTQDPKLIERTWKGIPDKWRATAWHAFLTASAKTRKDSISDEELIAAFEEYQMQSSPDDVQIDIDVPRTISSHIMFRRRYRGGQRLLFRVLHAMSLHFGDTGYVQGMAALAATLLAYYEEEKAFVMLVRLWELRGLDELYKSGFGGLMAALDDFEKQWLGAGELANKLTDLSIGPTAYGTRWYLTLFNYSIPFPAQLRAWDVFMLLGDDPGLKPSHDEEPVKFGTTLDILHATSAALIDGMREILMESDFENAMKVLTSWIPIKDEDLFMRVAKAEWKMHLKKT